MKQLSLLIQLSVLLVCTSFAQQSGPIEKRATPDLSKFSVDQLTACYDDSKICGANGDEISNEFIERLPSLDSKRLVECFDNWKLCGEAESRATGWPISDELARRGDISKVLLRYWREPKWMVRNGIEHVAYHFDTPEVDAFMRKVLVRRVYDGEDRYWPVNYLAKKCDPAALKELASGRYRNQGSLQYETSVVLFGKCSYRPAIPYLAGTALYDFSLNVVGAAEHSLRVLYPDAPTKFQSLAEEQQYFCRRARKDGFRMSCRVGK